MSNPTESHGSVGTEHVSTETSDEDRVQDATPEGSHLKSSPENNRNNRSDTERGSTEFGTNFDPDSSGFGTNFEPDSSESGIPESLNTDDVNGDASTSSPDEPDTFPRAYVEKLRKENADARAKVKDRDQLAQRLHTALAAADGRLADPTDLPFSEDQLDPEKMGEAITDLVNRKPHLKARRVTGDVGQGSRGTSSSEVNLLGLLKGTA